MLVDVIEDSARAQVLLHPARLELLENLAEPSSAAALSRKLGAPRQRLNYHLRELEDQHLIEVVQERRKGSVIERLYRRSGQAYAISTAALGQLGTSPGEVEDRFSSAYQIALASQAVRDLGRQQRSAQAAKKKLPTLALETEVRFASAHKRSAFADELTDAIAKLVAKYHDEKAPGGRAFKLYLGAYPRPKRSRS